ncbi:F0F1 ATP synthase subunit I [Psychromonas sp. CNPT3]|uniref:ATP synthase subunit I n=1 Tax=Psychromonas sp. CNPT3 TaxID=314282 RepID=UPI00006E7925|nr:ATP synthase subunit I [Psychromonas sp. CNPT3]AGH79981.1 F0F1 ATP synthase subunit I [Psychromonas sp. CNPT3]
MSDEHCVKKMLLIFFSQLVFIGFFSLFFYLTKDNTAGLSVVLGGLVYCVPAVLTSLFISRADNASAMLIIAKAYLGMFYKTMISIALFIYIFKHIPISIALFLTAYAATFITQYIMSYVLYDRK